MSNRTLTPEDLVTLRGVTDPEVSRDGTLIAGVVHGTAPLRGEPASADIWLSVDGAPARPVTTGPGAEPDCRTSSERTSA